MIFVGTLIDFALSSIRQPIQESCNQVMKLYLLLWMLATSMVV